MASGCLLVALAVCALIPTAKRRLDGRVEEPLFETTVALEPRAPVTSS